VKTFVHIGYFKCGSTALQRYLADNPAQLDASGVLYPDAGRMGIHSHSGVAFKLYDEADHRVADWVQRMKGWKQLATFNDLAAALTSEVANSSADFTVLSSEEFVRCGAFDDGTEIVERFASTLSGDVKLVAYLRRPDKYIVSWYGQLLRLGVPARRLPMAMDRFLNSIHIDFMLGLKPWIEVFGADAIELRNYETLTGNDVVVDFGEVLGRNLTGGTVAPRVNVGIPPAFYESVRRMNHASQSLALRKVRSNAIASLNKLPVGEKIRTANVELLGSKARQALYDHFAPINDQLGEIAGSSDGFFANLDQMLEISEGSVSATKAHQQFGDFLQTAMMGELVG